MPYSIDHSLHLNDPGSTMMKQMNITLQLWSVGFKAILILVIFGLSTGSIHAQVDTIKVHFIYGSKPKKEFKHSERKWFGGIHGGHVGIEIAHNRVLHFHKMGETRIFSKDENLVGRYLLSDTNSFWRVFSDTISKLKRTSIFIPIDSIQKIKLDSLGRVYLTESPYDYAFFGMRCAAAGYDILAHIDVMDSLSRKKTIRKIFYPKKLRKRLLKKAKKEHWPIVKTKGTRKRKWERD